MMAHHANAARDEMEQLADEFRVLTHVSRVPTPALDQLYAYMDPATLPLDWRGVWICVVVLAGLMGFCWLSQGRRGKAA